MTSNIRPARKSGLARKSHKFEKRCEARQNEIRAGSVLAAVPIWDI